MCQVLQTNYTVTDKTCKLFSFRLVWLGKSNKIKGLNAIQFTNRYRLIMQCNKQIFADFPNISNNDISFFKHPIPKTPKLIEFRSVW